MKIKTLSKIIFIFLAPLFLSYFLFPTKTYANSLYFREEFDGSSLDSTKWKDYRNAGQILVQDGKLKLSSSGNSFPYIFTKLEIFPTTEDFIISIKFKYNNVTCWGTGIYITDLIPENGPRPPTGHALTAIWQDCIYPLALGSSLCTEDNPSCDSQKRFYMATNLDTSEHVLKIIYRYSIRKFTVYLDDDEKFISPETDFIPKYIWIGHPMFTGHDDEWTSFEVDYIRVSPLHPIVFLPGMTGCWDNAIITGGEGDDWGLWLIAYQTTYKPFLKNLQEAHLVENQDYYVFCYDWRKPIEHNKEKLSTFIQNNFPPEEKIDLVGHSMGGLVARSFAQSEPEKINKLITIGSPHKGAALSYFAWEGGVILDNNPITKFIKELIIFLNSPLEQVPLRTIRAKIPSLKDLLPTYDFLVDKNNPTNIKPIANHVQKNDYFMNLNSTLQSSLKEKISTIYGIGLMALDKIKVISFQPSANWMHYVIGMWEDGEPFSQITNGKRDYSPSFIPDNGDESVTTFSATIEGVDAHLIVGDHLSIMKSPDALQKIFDLLGLEFPQEDIATTPIEKILALVLHSPANFWLTPPVPDSFYDESANTIIVLNPPDNLVLNVEGKNSITPQSLYEISFLELNNEGQLTTYRFMDKIDPEEEKQFPLDSLKEHLFVNENNQQALFDSLINKINQTKELLDDCVNLNPYQRSFIIKILNQAISQAQKYKENYDNQKYRGASANLMTAWQNLFRARGLISKFGKDNPCALSTNEHILSSFAELEYLYLDVQEKRGFKPSSEQVKSKLKSTKEILDRKNEKMQKSKDKGHKIYQYQGIAFTKAQEYYMEAQKAFSENKNTEAFLNLTLSPLFLYEL